MKSSKINLNSVQSQSFLRSQSPRDESFITNEGQMKKSTARDGSQTRKSIAMNRALQQSGSNQNIRASVLFSGPPPRQSVAVGQLSGVGQDMNFKRYVTKSLSEQDIMNLKQVFDYYDSQGAGMLSPNDLKLLLQQNGYSATKETLYEIFAEMDEEELGGITFDFFLKTIDPDRVTHEKKENIRRVYRKYDKRNKGFMTFEDFSNIVRHDLLENIQQDQLKEIFDKVDSNHDGKITFEDFYEVVTKKVYY